MKILYIDDNEINLQLFSSIIKSTNPSIKYIGISKKSELVDILGKMINIDLFIVDFTLENWKGDEAFSIICNYMKSPNVVIISAGIIKDIKNRFKHFDHQPLLISNRSGAAVMVRKYIKRA